MSRYAREERAKLTRLLTEAGPDAPLTIPRWTTRDLAAHLIVRERRPAGAGIVVKPLAGHLERVRLKIAARSWDDLVQTFATGPGFGVFALPGVEEFVNIVEFFVHGEDIRRARPDWEPRALEDGLADVLWSRLEKGARMVARQAPVGLVLKRPDGSSAVARKGSPVVTVTGDVGELLMFVYGRQPFARVETEGSADDVAAIMNASLGI